MTGETIYAISRSGDGYLWIGTDRGLVRFDGYTFDLIQQPIPNMPPIGRVRSLTTDSQGVLWIFLDGDQLLLYRNGKFEDAFATFQIGDTTITAMSVDRAGRVLLYGLETGMLRWENGKLNRILNRYKVPAVTSIVGSRDGRIWMGTWNDGLFVLEQGRVSKAAASLSDTKINALLDARNGGLWIGTDHGVRFLTSEGKLVDDLPGWTHRQQIRVLFLGTDGCVWAGTSEGLLRIIPDGETTLRRATDGHGAINAVLEDGEQNLWFGGTAGLERLQEGVFTVYSAAEGFPETPTGPIFVDAQGTVWLAPLSGGLFWYRDGRLRKVLQDGLDRDIIYSIDGGDDEIWLGRQRGGLTRIFPKGDTLISHTFTEKDGLAQNTVYAVHRRPNGMVWAGTVSGGVSVLEGSTFKTYSTANGLVSNTVNSIAESRDGTIWMASPSGLEEFRGGSWVNWTIKDGLPSAVVNVCFVDSQGVVWIATDGGLAYLSGGHITTLRNLPSQMREQIRGIAEGSLGSIWLATSDHVLSVDRAALVNNSLHVSDIRSYGMSTGLVRRERSLIADSSGRVWISLSRGIAMADPALTIRDALPIQVRIDSVLANGKSVNLNESPNVPAGTRSMTFHYLSDSLLMPENVRFRYRLMGADPDWSDAVESRQVTYHNLIPGYYRFEVIASRDGRFWNSPETVNSFSIDPAYWQTWWFRAAAVLAALLILLLIFRIRSIRLSRQLNARFHERLAERTRIAQELHDTLLQSFQGLMLRFQTIDNMLPGNPIEAKKVFEEALDRADDALTESRNAIQNIRSSPEHDSSLAQALNSMLATMAEQYFCEGTQGPSYSVLTEGTPKSLNPVVSAEILRIARESLRNSFQHANASRIETEVTFGEPHFRIRFRDDGVGIDPDILKNGSRLGHWGLIGMRERAAQIGAKLDVWSRPGAGTELDLNVPGRIAYERFKGKNRFQTLRKTLGKKT